MKDVIIYEILKKIESNKSLKKKLKIFAIVGIIGFFVLSAITVWVGIKAVDYVATKTKEATQSPIVKDYASNLNAELKTLSANQVVGCWGKAQSLLGLQVWIEKSPLDNLIDLKVACLDTSKKQENKK